MTYTKTTWVAGSAPGISAANLNNLETQYDEVKTQLESTTAGDISMRIVNINSTDVTTAGGTEASRLAKTNASGKVGAAIDSDTVGGNTVATGTYTGSGTSTRSISHGMGSEPVLVYVGKDGVGNDTECIWITSDQSYDMDGIRNANGGLTSSTFTSTINNSGVTYNWWGIA